MKGRYVNFTPSPTTAAAGGIYTLAEAGSYKARGLWPAAAATPVAPPLATSLLLHFDGANGSTTFTDSSPNNVSVTKTDTVSITTSASKFGGASAQFTYGRLSANMATDWLASEDWTIDVWVKSDYLYELYAYQMILTTWDVDEYGIELSLFEGDVKLSVYGLVDGGATISAPHDYSSAWTHIAATRSDGVIRLFIDGVSSGTTTKTPGIGKGSIDIGLDDNSQSYTGLMDELRIVRGKAAFPSGGFSPPAAPYQ